MASSYKDKIWQKNHLTSKQILDIEVHTYYISKHVSMCWFLNSSRFSVKLQMIFNLFPPPLFVEKIPPLEVRHALWMAPNNSGKLWAKLWTKAWTKLWTVNREPWNEADVPGRSKTAQRGASWNQFDMNLISIGKVQSKFQRYRCLQEDTIYETKVPQGCKNG